MLSFMEMPPRKRRTGTLIIALGVLAFLAAAVGVAIVLASDDDEDTVGGNPDAPAVDQYVEQMEQIGDDLDQRTSELQSEFGEELAAAEGEGARLALIKQNVSDARELQLEFLESIQGLVPPAALEEAHDGVVQAAAAYAQRYEVTRERIDEAQTFEDIQLIVSGTVLLELREELTGACEALVVAVKDQGGQLVLFC